VLVVDDSEVNRDVVLAILEKIGYRGVAVPDGRQALVALEGAPYDAILMDCQLPEMDGYAVTAEIRRREGTGPRTPIIALTAYALPEDRDRCLAAGMDDYLAKPVRPGELDATLGKWVPTVDR
jgi:CheY-like chemotaxis protein